MASSDHNLGPRGAAFYDAVVGGNPIDAANEVLIVEAARMADRLEDLADIIHGKGVINLMHLRHMDPADDSTVTMLVDSVFAETRQLQAAFERVSRSLKLAEVSSAPAKVDKSDDLAAKRAARRSASGS